MEASEEHKDNLNKRERGELRKKQREDEVSLERGKKDRKRRNKKIVIYSIVLVIVVGLGYLVFNWVSNYEAPETFTPGQVHWHSDLTVEICGALKELPRPVGRAHLGNPLLHTHEDGRIHVEGRIRSSEDITLGRYLGVLGVDFTNTRIFNTENGDLCDGEEGQLKMFVNGEENFEFRDYVIMDVDNIRLVFE